MDSPNLQSANHSPNLHSLGKSSGCESAYSKATPNSQHRASHSNDDDQSDNVNASMKRKRVHQLNEKRLRRRDKINKRLRALRSLIPNCTKMNKASVLDEAIDYLKSLQLQLQIMSFFSGLCVPPTHMILPTRNPIFGLPFAGYGTRFQIPLPMNELLRRSAQQP